MEIVEGRDQPWQGQKEFSDKGKAVSLSLHLTRPIWGSSKVVVLDSGFCVRFLKELEMKIIGFGHLQELRMQSKQISSIKS